MARRADHSREELMKLVLDAAEEIIVSEGILALSARKVAKKIGYSAGTIYNVFENLDELGLHVKARTLDALYAHIRDVPKGDDVEADFLKLNEAYFTFMEQNPKTWGSILERVGADGKPLPDWYLEKVALPFSVVEQALMPLFSKDERTKAEYAAHTLWCGVHGIAVLGIENSLEALGNQNARDMAAFLIKNFLKGLRSK